MRTKHGYRDYALDDPDQAFWREGPRRLSFMDDAQQDIDREIADAIAEFNRIWRAGILTGALVAALIWWWQS